ncbi:MAG: DNA-binding transcriptional regulator YiaG [Planctomycetota bacterium]|jgi:DNA-binding transcriptional regulator YiaG
MSKRKSSKKTAQRGSATRKGKVTKKTGQRRGRPRGPNRSDDDILAELQTQLSAMEKRVDMGQQFTPKLINAERERLELSAADYAILVGVTPLTIYNWEHGRSKPRAAQLERWLDILGIKKRAAWTQLGYE